MISSDPTMLLCVAASLCMVACSNAPAPTPDASTTSASSLAAPPREVTCDTVSERMTGSPDEHMGISLDGAAPALARYEGAMGVSVASAITRTEFTISDPLATGLQVDDVVPYTRHGSGPVRHPDVEPPRSALDRERAKKELRGKFFVVLVGNTGIQRYVPALDEDEALAMSALIAADACTP